MDKFSPLDLIRSERWTRSVFTTYSLSLSFFEAVVLDPLIRQQVPSNLILADVTGVREALAEAGIRGVGRSYELEPVAVDQGCFHPKIALLMSDSDAHILVGSGNLTFGGWGVNLESVEHLHPSFAAPAFGDAADFFDSLESAGRVRHAAQNACRQIAAELRVRGASSAADPSIRILHNLKQSMADQLASLSNTLSGAERITVAAPFYGASSGVDAFCAQLGLDAVYIHVHPGGAVGSATGTDWPFDSAVKTHASVVEVLEESPNRRLHAKVFEILCSKGRILVSGSPCPRRK